MNCPICKSKVTNLTYRELKHGTKHLAAFCELHGWRFLPFIKDLIIPTTTRKLKSKKVRFSDKRVIKETANQTSFLASGQL